MWPARAWQEAAAVDSVQPGDAAIHFKDILGNDPDKAKNRDANNNLIDGTGSEAFHIGLVNEVGFSGNKFTRLEIAR